MKPSEILDAVMKIENEIEDLKGRIEPLQDRVEVLGYARADIRVFLDRGEPWEKIEERLSDLAAGIIPDDPSGTPTTKPPRKPRADKGVPRKAPVQTEIPGTPKPHISDGKTSPLTPELRAKLEATLAHGPLQFPEIRKMSWTAGLTDDALEGLLCEDSKAFVQWAPKDLGGLEVWGTIGQFDEEVGRLKLSEASLDGRHKRTSEILGCSLAAAWDAWKRLDPRAS